MMWRDKAKSKWTMEGDANTHFFHMTTITNRRANAIHRIMSMDNVGSIDRVGTTEVFLQYFDDMFKSTIPNYPKGLQGLMHRCITSEMNNILMMAIPYGKWWLAWETIEARGRMK